MHFKDLPLEAQEGIVTTRKTLRVKHDMSSCDPQGLALLTVALENRATVFF
jgi:hypothetical protein